MWTSSVSKCGSGANLLRALRVAKPLARTGLIRNGELSSVFSQSFATNTTAGKKPVATGAKPTNDKFDENLNALVYAAKHGDLKAMEKLVKENKVDVNGGNIDGRTALHLAAAEGKVESIQWLLTHGALVDQTDRHGTTALDEAFEHRNTEAIKVLRAAGAKLNKRKSAQVVLALNQAASEDNIDELLRLKDYGADVNAADYDDRTALHLAASEGRVRAVEFLLKNGGNVNAQDRFGNTPLQDSMRRSGRTYRAVSQILKENGATSMGLSFAGVGLKASLQSSLPILCDRFGWEYAEVWTPTADGSEFAWSIMHATKNVATKLKSFLEESVGKLQHNQPDSNLGKAWREKKAVFITSMAEQDLKNRHGPAVNAGLATACVVPVLDGEGTVHGLLKFFSTQKRTPNSEDLKEYVRLTSGVVSAGVYGNSQAPIFDPPAHVPTNQMVEVYQRIVQEGVFHPNLVYAEVDWFYRMGLQPWYFKRFSAETLAYHIHSFIAAKKLSATTGSPEDIWLHIEGPAGQPTLLKGSTNWEHTDASRGNLMTLYMVPNIKRQVVEVEKGLEKRIDRIPLHKGYSLEFFLSESSHVPFGKNQMCLYVLQTNNYVKDKCPQEETDVWTVASEEFLKEKPKPIRERYQEVLKLTAERLSPLTKVFDTYRDGTLPIMFAFRQGTGSTTSYLAQLSSLMSQNNMTVNRKFIETFSNGTVVFSFYLAPAPKHKVDMLVKQFSMLHLVPKSEITPYFLSGALTAEEYTYSTAVGRFIYYFLSQRNEEMDALVAHLKTDTLNLGRLTRLHTNLKREAVSHGRINQVFLQNPPLLKECFADFQARVTVKWDPASPPAENQALIKRVKAECDDPLEAQIWNAVLTFNRHVLKTNFYRQRKSALSFRFDPSFLIVGDWPVVPFALFFCMGSDFQGFHLRFQDIARGGIRIIRSRDRTQYNHNLSTLFAENYGLAFTQNKKNKDIPEFGSKGTVLLNKESQNTAFLAFQKYVSSLLDLLIEPDDPMMVDNYGRPEILFLGPDEGTAEFMEWACVYAQKRKYKYWRAFTTGKPPALGGIPHDMFGMTTRSIHRYVLGCLDKLGLKEDQVTKFQTGGPDGDLGSNEIKISKDRTIGIVDGSGVIFDPAGLNRAELMRLATKRVMIGEFDVTKLSPKGFRVLLADKNVKLPHGEIVDSGVAFRNEFHLHPLTTADMFVPCGGRPEAVNLSNVGRLIDDKGKAKFKMIIEGANLFFSQDARAVLEGAGVVLYKDASTNKGGVTSSSLEVLAALSLSETEFAEHMAVQDVNNFPPFYRDYVEEIQKRIENDADLEFECLWRESKRTGIKRYIMTDMISDKINELANIIMRSELWENEALRKRVLMEALPKKLTQVIGYDNIAKRVPPAYLQSIFGSYLSSRYVYRVGIGASEFAFFEFMRPYFQGTTPSLSSSTSA